MDVLRRLAGGQVLLAVSLWLPTLALAEDPTWYSDIQYLTWDVRADEAEASRGEGMEHETFLQPSADPSAADAILPERIGRFDTVRALPTRMMAFGHQLTLGMTSWVLSGWQAESSEIDAIPADAIQIGQLPRGTKIR